MIEHGFGEAHQQAVHPAAKVTGQRADQDADEDFDQHGRQADQQRDLPAVDGAGQDIAPDRIGAKGVSRRGRLQAHRRYR